MRSAEAPPAAEPSRPQKLTRHGAVPPAEADDRITRPARPSMGEPSLSSWRKTASPSSKPPALSRRPLAGGPAQDGARRSDVLGELTSAVEQLPVDPAQWNAREVSGAGPGSKRGLVNGDRRPIPRGRARSRKPAYFFFLAAFFFVAFFFPAFFFAISNHLLECFVPCDEIAFPRRDTGGGRVKGGRGGTVARRPSVARGLMDAPAPTVPSAPTSSRDAS